MNLTHPLSMIRPKPIGGRWVGQIHARHLVAVNCVWQKLPSRNERLRLAWKSAAIEALEIVEEAAEYLRQVYTNRNPFEAKFLQFKFYFLVSWYKVW